MAKRKHKKAKPAAGDHHPPADHADDHHETVLEATGALARIAQVYAEALMAAARKAGQVDSIGEELTALVDGVIGEKPQIEAFLTSGAIGRKARGPILDSALTTGTSELVRNFVGVLNLNNRLGLLRPIAATYRQLRDEASGVVRVRVASAVPLSDAQQARLKNTLSAALGSDPVIDLRTDPDLLGGLVVHVGDRVYDTSVRTRLETLRTHLMASGSHGS
jgi:F-type H+-transporting ATPase subunit delta